MVKMVKRRVESEAVLAGKKGHLLPLVSIGPSRPTTSQIKLEKIPYRTGLGFGPTLDE